MGLLMTGRKVSKKIWEGDWGLHDREDAELFGVPRGHDTSSNGNPIDHENSALAGLDTPIRVVRHQGFVQFRRDLFSHFTLAFEDKAVRWPSRNGSKVWSPSAAMRAMASEFGVEI